MKAVIMAGGKGTRLASVAQNIPKPMFSVSGKPILEYQIESLKKSGIIDIIIIIGHLGSVIQEYFEDGSSFDVHITYIIEKVPLGTAGALFYLKEIIGEDFFLLFGDLILDVDFNRFMNFHKQHTALITLFGHPNSHPQDSDIIVINRNNYVKRIISKKEERKSYYHNFVNAGLYCINSKVLDTVLSPVKLDFEQDIIAKQIERNNVCAYRSTEYVKDMGTPDRLEAVTKDVENGIVAGRSLKNRQIAIFLDRDGSISEYVVFLRDTCRFKFLPAAAEAIAKINASPYLTIVTANQTAIARGEVYDQELDDIHRKMEMELGTGGAYLDDLFFCSRHQDKGYRGGISELRTEGNCCKPMIEMLESAAEKYNIDLKQSWYVGNTTLDIQTGKNAGMRTVLLQNGGTGNDREFDVKADYIATDLLDAVNHILW